jgi:translation initiation factor 2 beta subunit (eIF-2beta)/eIF-5
VLNVGGTQVEIPIVIGKIEGRGNGIKTNVSNVVQISKIIKRHPAWTSKYLGCELGCVNSYDFDSGYSVLTGKHEDDKLQKVFKKYIKDFVLCPKCKGLQTKLDLDKKNKVKIKCKACGHKAEVDQSHKVVKEIIKVPPGSEIMAKKEKGVKPQGKKSRRSALKEGGDTEALDDEEEGGDAGGDAADDGGISAAAAAADAAEDEDEEAKAARRKKEKEEKAARKQAKADKVAAKEAKAAKSAGKANAREEKAKRLAAEATGDEYVPPVAAAADTEPAPEPAAAASAPEPAPEPAAAAAATDDAAELRAKIDGEGLAVATSFWNTKCKGLPVESAVRIGLAPYTILAKELPNLFENPLQSGRAVRRRDNRATLGGHPVRDRVRRGYDKADQKIQKDFHQDLRRGPGPGPDSPAEVHGGAGRQRGGRDGQAGQAPAGAVRRGPGRGGNAEQLVREPGRGGRDQQAGQGVHHLARGAGGGVLGGGVGRGLSPDSGQAACTHRGPLVAENVTVLSERFEQ